MAASRFFSLYWLVSWRMASTMAVEFIRAPSTMASGGSGATPKASRMKPRLASLSWTSFTELLPMSSPSASLLFAMIVQPFLPRGTLPPDFGPPKKTSISDPPGSSVEAGEELLAVVQLETQREEDLALGLHPA